MVWAGISIADYGFPLTPFNKPEMKASDLKHPGKIPEHSNLLSVNCLASPRAHPEAAEPQQGPLSLEFSEPRKAGGCTGEAVRGEWGQGQLCSCCSKEHLMRQL